mgnify:CR=1 FL=1
MTKKLGGTWARKDSKAALEWAETLDPKLWNPTSASIIGNLPKEELALNSQWIKESSTDGRHDGVRAAYAMRMADEDPYSAIEQALLMKDTLGREKVTVHIAKKIYKETITKFQPAKIRGQRELGAPKRKKGEPKPKVQNVRTDPRIIAPTPITASTWPTGTFAAPPARIPPAAQI